MELEALKSKFDEALGSTKLQLSEQTLNGVLQDALAEIGDDDSRLTDDFITRKVNLAKTIDGQINFDVSNRIKDYEKKNPRPKQNPKPQEKPNGDDEPEWFKSYREAQEAKIAELENARKADLEKQRKETMLEKVRTNLKAKLEESGAVANSYIMRQTLRDIEIGEDSQVSELVKQMEKAYYKNLKDAGFEETTPHLNSGGNGKGSKITNDFFERKKAKEGWGKK